MDFKKFFSFDGKNTEALRQKNQQDGIEPAPHEALLDEKPIGIAPEDFRKEILRTAVAPIPKPLPEKIRGQVQETLEPLRPQNPGLDYFENQIESDPHLNNAFSSLAMVWGLLQQHYRAPQKSVLNEARFEKENLTNLLEAILGTIKGRQILGVDYVRQYGVSLTEIIYSDIFSLSADAEQPLRDAKIQEFLTVMDQLPELLAYPYVDNVDEVLLLQSKKDSSLTVSENVDETGIRNEQPLLFDVRAIQQILGNLREKSVAEFYNQFYEQNKDLPACSSLDCLQKALRADAETYELYFQDQHLRGKSMVDAVRHLDALFPEIRGAGRALLVASRDTATLTVLLRDIAETHKIAQNPAAMQAKLNDIHQRLTRAFPKLANKRVAENMDKPAIQFEEEWKAIWKAPETARPFSQLHNLYYAFLNYSDKRKEQLFGGDELDVMLKKMSDALGPGLCAAMKRASVKKEDPYRCYALMQVIAKHSDTTRNPEDLKAKLIRIGRILEQTYPDLHNNLT